MAAATGGILVVAVYLLGTMIAGDGASLFFQGRIDDPLGSINSQGLFMILAVWRSSAWHSTPGPSPPDSRRARRPACWRSPSSVSHAAWPWRSPPACWGRCSPGRLQRAWLLLVLAGGSPPSALP